MNYLGQPFYALSSGGGGTGDVVGPSTSTINAVPRFTGTSGNELKNSVVIVSDTGAITGSTSIETDAVTAPSWTLNMTTLFLSSLPEVPANRGTALIVLVDGPTTSPVPPPPAERR